MSIHTHDVAAERERWARRALRMRELGCAALLTSVVAFAAYGTYLRFLRDPPVWPDEALFASPARELLHHGRLGTRVLEGLLPGIERMTYYVPPVYLVALSSLFALFGESIVTMRAFSVLCACVVAWLLARISRQLGADRGVALLAPALLLLDPVFSRGSRIGRMDMLALACVLGAVTLALSRDRRARAALCSGVFAGLAVSVHPMATAALPVCLLAAGLREPRQMLFALAGMLLGSLPWTLLVLSDVPAFADQWHAQLVRKGETFRNYGPSPWSAALDFAQSQYPPALRRSVLVLHAAAALGMLLAALQRRVWLVPLTLHLLLCLSIVRGAEMWYPAYGAPTLALGLIAPLSLVGSIRVRASLGVASLACLSWFALQATRHTLDSLAQPLVGLDYHAFGRAVVARLPHGARVMFAAIPDPYFATFERPDLTVREFLPGGIPLPLTRAERVLEETDFVVVGRFVPTAWIARTLAQRGREIAQIGAPTDDFVARIYALEGSSAQGRQ